MGKIIIYGNKSGEGGADTSDVTATSEDVLIGKVIVDAEGEIVVGTMTNHGAVSQTLNVGNSYTIPAGYHNGSGKVTANDLTGQTPGTASAGEIIKDKTAWVNGSQVTGTMPNHGAVAPSALNCGGSYTIPAGYHNGSGKVTANSLANQTDATATKDQILSGKTAWVKGSKLTGTLAVTSAINFKAAAQSTSVIRISWTNPSVGPWSGVKIRMSTSGNPGVSGGTLKYTGTGSSTTPGGTSYVDISGLEVGTTYYFTCYSYSTDLGDSSTSYNVSAKTKGLLIYKNGTQYISLTAQDANNMTTTFNSTNIQFTKKTKFGSLTIKINTGNMDLSGYTRLCSNVSITHNYYTYIKQSVGYISTSSDQYHTTKVSTNDTRSKSDTYFASPISELKYTYGSLLYKLTSIDSKSGSGSVGGISGYVYKIWLE